MSFDNTCKICKKTFKSKGGLHNHIKKIHDISQKKYYEKYFPRFSLLNKDKIKFSTHEDYFKKDFTNKKEFCNWCLSEERQKVSEYLINLFNERKNLKNLKYLPCEVELNLLDYPSIDILDEVFMGYSQLGKAIKLENYLNKNLPEDFFEDGYCEKIPIFIDTREQKPIKFENSNSMKLDFGDYTAAKNFYDYTYVDRKSEQDFKSTLSGSNYDRFIRELERAKYFNSYIFIVVESSIEKIKTNNIFCPHKAKLPYIWHNVKYICQNYKNVCQFVFAGNRSGLKKIIPKILYHGKDLWETDLQFYLNKKIYEKRNDIMVP